MSTEANEPAWTDLDVTVADRWTYTWADRKRPHLHPVATPAGHVLTCNEPEDHFWHHGLWFTIKYLDEDNFWEEMPPYGVLRHDERPEVTHGPDGQVALSGELRWTRPDRETVALVQQLTLTHVPLEADAYAIDLDTTLTATDAVRLDRTEYTTWGGYGGFTIRGTNELVDTTLLLPDGSRNDRLVGVPGRWCDVAGTVTTGGANAPAGLAIFDHPGNVRHPVPWYGTTWDGYGEGDWTNFCNAAFLWEGPLELAAGESLRVRHRALVHDGHWPVDRLDAAWHAWAD
ncbi:PmoA family protein [Aquihabitans sp. G128]|uniref:DUF6807 domain-containing protein n=1 Tax=Aquihabitans sp. G128 TaxID=2849779 RepID=UPI001C23F5E9|nr:PmoA family protein [Aquihabitans sp. G128]QXC62406.1 PmoA family protein [Aquihabitans sp. G128]